MLDLLYRCQFYCTVNSFWMCLDSLSRHLVMCLCFCMLWLYFLYYGQISEENKSRLHVTVLTLHPLSGCIPFCIVNKRLLFLQKGSVRMIFDLIFVEYQRTVEMACHELLCWVWLSWKGVDNSPVLWVLLDRASRASELSLNILSRGWGWARSLEGRTKVI